MKKFLCMTLALLMLLSFMSCGKSETENENLSDNNAEIIIDEDISVPGDAEAPEEDENSDTAGTEEKDDVTAPEDVTTKPQAPASKPQTPADTQKPQSPADDNKPQTPPEDTPSQGGDTVGDIMLGIFRANRDKTPEEIANACISHSEIKFSPMTTPLEPGYFSEFGGDISGFTSCVKFGPMIGSIPFAGFVFEVADDADAFAKMLRSSADPRWNICVEAEQTVCEVYGNKVFFLMCPKVFAD